MPSPSLLRSLLELAACDDVQDLLDATHHLIQRELAVRAAVELWNSDARFTSGERPRTDRAHRTWVGIRYTLGAIHLHAPPRDVADIDLVALQLAPLAELLLDRDASQRRTIREDINLLYERRIREALIRHDWNASAVARELRIGRGRVGEVAHRYRPRTEQVFWNRTVRVITNSNTDKKEDAQNKSLLRESA